MTQVTVARGVIMAVDVGTVRVGVAASDPSRILASPVVTLTRDRKHNTDLRELAALVVERDVVDVVVGLPRTLADREGSSVTMAKDYAARLQELIAPVPVRLVDERLTTVLATSALRASGIPAKRQRGQIDQAAAVALLQGVLEAGSRA